MSHLVRYGRTVETTDFNAFWKTTVSYSRDGCNTIKIIHFHDGNCSKSVIEQFFKKMENRESPSSYTVNAYDCGISGWETSRKVMRIVDHKRTEVTEKRRYKSKPKRVSKGAILKTLHTYIIDWDVREYEPYEHCQVTKIQQTKALRMEGLNYFKGGNRK